MRVIGMISGTSFDAIEAVAVHFEREGDTLEAQILAHRSAPYPEELADRIAAALPPHGTTMEEVCALDTLIGQVFAEVASGLSDEIGGVDVVCSHGQTLFHWVDGGRALGTLQLGQPAWIAERTGATVVADVRAADVAAGGQGAPLASLLDVLLLGDGGDRARAALNLGGIANVTIVAPGREPVAFDTGPANALMDAVVADVTGGAERMDRDGARAARGRVDEELLAHLLDEPYYRVAPPKSTGKELFHLEYVRAHLAGRDLSTDDLLATLAALSAETVAAALRTAGVAEVFVAGGGLRNPVVMSELARRLPGVRLAPEDELGVPAEAKEALLFAVIGYFSVHGWPATVPSCTGARGARILGALVGPRPRLELHHTHAPTSLHVRTRPR